MNDSELNKGRVRQKFQTRSVILDAAQILMMKNKEITLEDVAAEANVSRATVYRYFSNIDLLYQETSLDLVHKSPDELCSEVEGMSLSDRIFYIQEYYSSVSMEYEVLFRRYLSVVLGESVKSQKDLRGSRRLSTLIKSLKPFENELDKDTYHNLISISAILMGIDSLIASKDVCGLNNEESKRVLKWALEMILKVIHLKD